MSATIKIARLIFILSTAVMMPILPSCNDEEIIVPPDNSGSDHVAGMNLFCYDVSSYNTNFCLRTLSTEIGSPVQCATDDHKYLNHWAANAGVKAGNRQFIFFHENWNGPSGAWLINEISASGRLGNKTDEGRWSRDYPTIVGFHVGDKGFIFGQGTGGYWFVQEITGEGKLGNETDNATWHNYYQAVTPLYVNGNTYLFFQTKDSDHYWFITRVSGDGRLTDVCDGYWGALWNPVTSVTVSGKTYLIGDRKIALDPMGRTGGEWFIQAINDDGTMGEETDRGTWNYYYSTLIGYSYGGKAYIFGHSNENGMCFIQEILAGGKMGAEASHSSLADSDSFFCPFTVYEPGNFRYKIGWDLSSTTLEPAGSWSASFMDPWYGATKLGGGAALANIDRDAEGRLDAVMMGIQDIEGGDRFYYKVAWNLDNTGQSAGWTQTVYGPYVGQLQSGGGADIADIDGNGLPDLLLMVVDNPEYGNAFWYNIGWNLGTDGKAASWSQTIQVGGLGYDDAGGGAALGDLDKNGQVDAVFVAIDAAAQDNSFWYTIGKNLDKNGAAQSWTNHIIAPCNLGWDNAGGGAALADLNGNGKLDLILTGIDSPSGANPFWYYVGWDLDINGNVSGWSGKLMGPALGNMTQGGGLAVGDINKNGKPDLFLMAVDDPYGKD